MRPISHRRPPSTATTSSWPCYTAAAAVVTAAATTASLAGNGDSAWYRALAKPPWQPPARAFGAVWTPLYASIAWAGGHALARSHGTRRRHLAASLGANLAINASWSWLFFRLRSPRAAAGATLLLDASNADLIHRTARTDGTAALALVPYAAWCLFATVLATDIAVRNT